MSYSPHAFGITKGESAGSKFYLADANGDIEFQDNDKIIFGDGADASIYWNASALLIANESSQPITLGHASATVTIPGNLTVSGTTTTVDSTTVNLQNGFVFEGATDDDFETTLTMVDPTADRTIYLPNVGGYVPVLAVASTTAISSTPEELNLLDGVTSSTAELNILDGVTSTAAELNILDGVTSTAAELNILDGVTSTAAELNILDGVTSTAAELNILDGVTATSTELNYLDIVTLGTAAASKAVTVSAGDKITLGTIEIEGSAFDIDGGNIDGATLGANSTVTVTDLTMTLGSDVDGDIYYRTSNKLTRLAKGTGLQVLRMNSGATAPEWATSTSAAIDGTANGVDNRIATYSSASALNGEANLTFDGSTLTVTGDATIADGTNDLDVASHDGTNGLKLAGTLVTATAAELNIMDGVTSTTAELNILDGVTVTTGQINNTVTTPTAAAPSALTSSSTRVHLVDTSSNGNATITLTADQTNGTMFTIKKTTSDANTVTITSSDNIDGSSADIVLYYHNESVTLVSDSANYFII